MWDNLIDMAKGVAWGLVILILICMCQGCKSTKHAERILVTDQEGVRVTKSADSIAYTMLVRTIRDLMVDAHIEVQSEKINYSVPDGDGLQYVTSIERTQSAQTAKMEHKDTQVIITDYTHIQNSIDSIRQRVTEIEQTKEDTQKTSGGILGWSGDEALPVLVIILLIMICWIAAKKLL